MDTIFTKIINGEIPCYKIAENDDYLAFLDIAPLVVGHVLVVPKIQIDYIFDLDDAVYLGLMAFAKQVAAGIKLAVPCRRVAVAVIGIEVPHAHVHLIPINNISDCNFSNKKLQLSADVMQATTAALRAAVVA